MSWVSVGDNDLIFRCFDLTGSRYDFTTAICELLRLAIAAPNKVACIQPVPKHESDHRRRPSQSRLAIPSRTDRSEPPPR